MNNTIYLLIIAASVPIRCGILNGVYEQWKWQINPLVRIIDGIPVVNGEYPSIVSIQENDKHICGGNIINEDTILTAAHCTIDHDTSAWEAYAGITNLKDTFTPYAQKSKIDSVIVHPNFEKHSSLFDIAIAKVVNRFIYTPSVNYINLHVASDIPEFGEIIGWGSTSESGPVSNILLKSVITVRTKEQCIEEYGDEIEEGLICAKTNHGDACNGDSGGPLICDSKELCGIISSGKGCGRENESALYTEVSYFIDWIMDAVNNS